MVFSDDGVTVDGQAASTDPASAVYVGAEIVYYEDGHDETYGEGTAEEAHSADEAAAHTVVTITQPGTYRLSGTLSAGQVAVDLGEEETQLLLTRCGRPVLYPRSRFDAAVLYGLSHHLTLEETDELLLSLGEAGLL